jgi:hypothetical protein
MSLARWAQSRREQAPPLWTVFCTDWLQLSRNKSEQWWAALAASHWSRGATLRSTVLSQSALATESRQVVRLYTDLMAPGELIAGLEDLILEGRLPPVVSRRIEEAVLRQTDRSGQWKGA